MKKILLWAMILCAVLTVTACSSGPVPFTEKLGDNRECYIDVVEVIPQSRVNDPVFLYCWCLLAEGKTIWMEITPERYIQYFDSEAVGEEMEELEYTARKVRYDEPVRLNGRALSVVNSFAGGNDQSKFKVFRFISAEEEATRGGERQSAAVAFDKSLSRHTVAYADVVSVEYRYDVSIARGVTPNAMVLKCRTAEGGDVWMLIGKDDYHRVFNGNADFVEPVRVSGFAEDRRDLFNAVAEGGDIPWMILRFREADEALVQAAKLSNQPPVPFAEAERSGQPAYVDITAITPELARKTLTNPFPSDLVCRCATADGQEVWLMIPVGNYIRSFFDDYASAMGVEKQLPAAVRVVGLMRGAGEIADTLPAQIGQERLIVFREATAP